MNHPLHQLPQPIGILAEGAHSTKAYWLEGAQASHANPERIYTLDPQKKPEWTSLQHLRSIVVIRTVPHLWMPSLIRLKRSGVRIALLLDDALLDPQAVSEQRLQYRLRLWLGITCYRKNLDKVFSELWVTTLRLASICGGYLYESDIEIKLMPLAPSKSIVQTDHVFRIAYLGTASHEAELRWMLSLLKKLQTRRDDCLLELVLPAYWRRKYRFLARSRFFYPMEWQTYLLDTGNRQVDLLLVPLLPSRFNAGRSATKFFEAARLKAAGLYSEREPYEGFIRNNIDGLLVPDRDEAWLSAIESLLDEPKRRSSLAMSCRKRALDLCTPESGVEWSPSSPKRECQD